MFAPVRTRSVFGALAAAGTCAAGRWRSDDEGSGGTSGAGNSNCLRYVKGPMPDTRPSESAEEDTIEMDVRRSARVVVVACCAVSSVEAERSWERFLLSDGMETVEGGETVVCVTCVIIGTLAKVVVVVVGGAGDDGRETPDDDPKTSSEGMHSPRCRMSFSIRRLRMRASSTSSRSSNSGEHGSFSTGDCWGAEESQEDADEAELDGSKETSVGEGGAVEFREDAAQIGMARLEV